MAEKPITMHFPKWRSRLAICLITSGLFANPAIAIAQSITIDGTLSPAKTLTGPVYQIPQIDGAIVGTNLFHSFGRFNLSAGETARFESAAAIRNIISRVTGGTASSIDGLILTESATVNLFLINPAGILLGANAQLDVGGSTRGSFVATTLDAIAFPGGGQFSAVNPGNAGSLLTLVGDPSGFLASQRQPGAIASTSNVLKIYRGQSLLLLGGEVQLNDSIIEAPNGRVELAGVAGAGFVGLTTTGNTLTLDISAQIPRSDVSLSNRSILFVANQGAGSIAVTSRNLDIAGSFALAGISDGQTASSDRPGAINLNATDAIAIRQGSILSNSVFGGVGDGGDIQIQTGSLQVTDESVLANFHTGIGKGGNLVISARGSVTFDGGGDLLQASATTFALRGQGDAGDIRISANQLNLLNGGKLQTSTNRLGNAGQIALNIQDATVMDGTARNPLLTSGIFSFVGSNGVGRGGDIQLTTGSLSVTNGATVRANTFGQGDGGDITLTARDTVRLDGSVKNSTGIGTSGIQSQVEGIGNGGTIRIATRDLIITNGAEIDVSTFGQGNTGNILIDASNAIAIDGEATEQLTPATGQPLSFVSSIGANVFGVGNGGIVQLQTRTLALTNGGSISTVVGGQGNAAAIDILALDSILISGSAQDGGRSNIASAVNQGEFNGVLFQGIGQGGDIRLVTGDLFLDQKGVITASAFSPAGTAGNIAIQANTIRLDHNSGIGTNSASSNGGNITLTVRDYLLLRRNSVISATAGTAQAGGNGGNIAIAAPNGFVIGVKAENSDIKANANAFTGSGGRVNITARGIYGLQFRPQLTAFSDITASSEFGISGTVTLNTPDVDPSRGLAQLNGALVDPTQQIDQRCSPKESQRSNSFVSTGRGGLPSTPFEPLQKEDTPVRWVMVGQTATGERRAGTENRGQASSSRLPAASPTPIIEAQGWVQQPDGSIYLVAKAQTNEPRSFWLGLPECPSMLQRE